VDEIGTAAARIIDGAAASGSRSRGEIPRGIPVRTCPMSGSISFSLITGALAVAAIVLIQGAGVAEAAPSADGAPRTSTGTSSRRERPTWRRVSSGPCRWGGSVGQTALNVSA
jgi:SulP family sulfate permease